MNDRRDNRDRPRAQWEIVKTFEDDNFIVEVSKLALHFPKFSISISAKNRDGKPMRFLPVRGNTSNGIFTLRPLLADLREFIDGAEAYVERELQRAEDWRLEESERKAKREQARGPKQRPGLKELSKRDRKKRQREREAERDGES